MGNFDAHLARETEEKVMDWLERLGFVLSQHEAHCIAQPQVERNGQ